MKNKNRKMNGTVIVLLIIAALLTLLILSNKIWAINAGEKTTIDKLGNKTVGDFARYIAYSPNAFMEDDVNKIFSLDNNVRTWYRLDNTDEPLLNYGGNDVNDMYYQNNEYYYYVTATWYNTCVCIYYSTAGGEGATSGNIVNVIDIDTNPSNPSMTTYYESNGSVKSQYTSLSGNQNQTMTSYAYLLNQASLYERKYDSSTGKWPLEGTFTKDLSSDSKISGWSRMYDTRFWNGRPISKIKEAIIQVLYGGKTGEQISREQTVLKIFSNIKDSSGKRVVNLDYAGLTNSYYRIDFESDFVDSKEYVNNAIAAGSKAVEASCEFKTTDDNGNALVPQAKIVGDNAYIGPFAVIYTGGTPTMTIEGVAVSGWARLNTSGNFEATNTTAIPVSKSNDTEIFYLVVPASSISDKEKLNVNINLGYEYYKARVAFTAFRIHGNQNLMFYTAKKHTGNLSDSIELQLNKKITIQKQDANGNNLEVAGIKFYIYNSSNTYIGCLETNNTGKTNTLELIKGQEYTIKEMTNNLYGFKGCIISNAEIVSGDGTIAVENGNAKVKITEDSVIAIGNQPELGEIIIHKTRQDGENLEGVEFVLWKGNAYLKLDEDSVINPIVTNNEGLDITKYNVTTVKTAEEATKFKTNESGKIIIKNLEIYSGRDTKYNYWLQEIKNDHYGQKGMLITENDVTITGGNKLEVRTSSREIKFDITNSTTVKINNTPSVGNLKLEKVDDSNSNIKLENVGFAIEITPSLEKAHAYLALYDKDGKIVSNIKGTTTININNEANDDGKEYRVSYYYTDKAITEFSDEDKANITTFVTEKNGTLTVNNLEVYLSGKKDKYEYKLTEISNTNYGFEAEWTELGNVKLEHGKTTEVILGNKQKYIKLSGYVWIENPSRKINNYNGLYTQEDMKLTDLYIIKDGQLIKNPEVVTPVEIQLRNKVTGEILKQLPDEFDNQSGKYTFKDLLIDELTNYEVVFVYDGFYYTTIVPQIDKENGSKVQELASERTTLNNKFATIKDNNEVVCSDGTINKVEYYKDGHTSTVSELNFDTTVSATTTISDSEYNLRKAFDALKVNAKVLTNELQNVNMGIVLREQPQISLNSDIYSVLLEFEGHTYNYKYNGRQNYYESIYGEDFGVKFEEKFAQVRYTRTVYASDVKAAKDLNKEVKVAVTYKIRVENQSRTLSVLPKQIINYFDSRYEVKAVGLELNDDTHIASNTLSFTTPENVEGNVEYKSTVIDFNQTIGLGEQNVKNIYITFDIQREAIIDLLNNKSTYHNASEILSYASMYGEQTAKVDGVQFTTDTTKAGSIYAGIDKMSQPGNAELKLIDHPSVVGTKVLDTANFEDDTASAPSLLLEATEARKVSGTIFEDTDTGEKANQKVGNGKYNEGEKPIQNVKVELRKIKEDGGIGEVASYSNGHLVEAVTDQNGNYTFGKYEKNADGTIKECYGILPGKYVIQYTYNNESFIVDTNGNKKLNVNDYKSTIITSDIVKNAFNGQNERWYIVQEDVRYSDARDDISLRPEYSESMDANITVTNSTYNNILSIDTMKANTPVMDVSLEFTEADEADALSMVREVELKNIDFGIIERPNIDITIEKQITGLEIIASNGTNIIPKGDPSDLNSKMQYVKKLDGLVSAEIEAKLLQGAELNLEYTITLVNNSDKDYLHEDYYYYGIERPEFENTPRAKQVVDYLDATMTLDVEQSGEAWTEKDAKYLYNTDTKQGLVTEEVYNELKSGKYTVIITEAFKEVGAGNKNSVKLYASKALAVSDSINEGNRVEIIEITGKRTIKDSIPGNYNPATNGPHEIDDDKIDLVITPPTGTTVNYLVYIIAATVTFAILVSGIVIIKKKIIK